VELTIFKKNLRTTQHWFAPQYPMDLQLCPMNYGQGCENGHQTFTLVFGCAARWLGWIRTHIGTSVFSLKFCDFGIKNVFYKKLKTWKFIDLKQN
jgi:hypothetical protein